MKVTVKFFGLTSALLGRDVQSLGLPAGATVAQLFSAIQEEAGTATDTFLQKANILVNRIRADRNTILHDGDEVIIMFFLGGG